MVVVNPHLYGLDLATGGAILPEHDVVIVDEAHQLEDIISATLGVEIGAGRFAHLARAAARHPRRGRRHDRRRRRRRRRARRRPRAPTAASA